MLELEPPRHTRLRNLVLRAFTSRRIAALEPEIAALAHRTGRRAIPAGEFDLLQAFAQPLPVRIIARLLGVPEDMAPDLLRWSNAMVGMYMAGRTREMEDTAVAATEAFVAFLRGYVDERRARPADDLITQLIAAEMEGEKLTTDELITTCILLLNAGHEATVHTIGNGVKTLLETGTPLTALAPDAVEATVEEILRFDPALHMFTRQAYDDIEVMGHTLPPGRPGRPPARRREPRSRRTGTSPTSSSPPARSSHMPASARASTSASARRWPGWSCRSPCRSSSSTTPACASPPRPPMPTSTTSTA